MSRGDAMVSVFAPVSDTRPDEFRRVIEVNYRGHVYGKLAALRPCARTNLLGQASGC